MSDVVVDASALVDWSLDPVGTVLDELIGDPAVRLHAPVHLDLETLQAIRRFERSGRIDEMRAARMVRASTGARIERHKVHNLARVAWTLRANMTIYDATYVALAALRGADLITGDRRLERAVKRHRPDVRVRLSRPAG